MMCLSLSQNTSLLSITAEKSRIVFQVMLYIMRRVFLGIVLVLLCVWNCSKPIAGNEPEAVISFPSMVETAIVVSCNSGEYSISFLSSRGWRASLLDASSDSWCDITPKKGEAGSNTIRVSVKENSSYEERRATLQIRSEAFSKEILITQKSKDIIKAETIKFGFDSYSLSIGQKFAPEINVYPLDAILLDCKWTSDNPSIASVSEDGTITAESFGETIIHVTSGMASCSLKIVVMATANCYLISSPGTYDIPLFKGKTNQALNGVSDVKVLWESFGDSVQPNTGDIIKTVSLDHGLIHFTTSNPLKDGNALIAAYCNNKIVWSWHIWVCDGFIPEDLVCQYSSLPLFFMDRNIGATSATPGNIRSLGLYYQWGRKDPFIGPSEILGERVSEAKSTKPTSGYTGRVSTGPEYGTIEYATEHPMTIITTMSSTLGDWFYLYRATSFWNPEVDGVLYDPCPYGWHVPRVENWNSWVRINTTDYGFETGSYTNEHLFDSTNYGMLFGDEMSNPPTWYPAAGYKLDDGTFWWLGEVGRCWSGSVAVSAGSSYVFQISNTGEINSRRICSKADLYPVRCVKD